MNDFAIAVRPARPDDAAGVARVYIDAWHDTYPAILPSQHLCAMSSVGQTSRWRAAILARGRENVLVADCPIHGIVGLASFGPAQDPELLCDGEVYTLYVAPDFFNQGIGRRLLTAAFAALQRADCLSCVIWAHAQNPARFFYEAMGGRLIAERSRHMMGVTVPEAAFGWRPLILAGWKAPGSVSRR